MDCKQNISWLVWVSPHLHSWAKVVRVVFSTEGNIFKRLMRWLKWDVNRYYLLMPWMLGNSLSIDHKDVAFELTFFFFFFFKDLFIDWLIEWLLCWVLVSVLGLSLVAASRGHSSSWCAGLPPSWPLLLRSTGSRRTGSVIVAHGPSCSVACGIFPDQGSNPCPLHWQADSQPLCHQGGPWTYILSLGSDFEGKSVLIINSLASLYLGSMYIFLCKFQVFSVFFFNFLFWTHFRLTDFGK